MPKTDDYTRTLIDLASRCDMVHSRIPEVDFRDEPPLLDTLGGSITDLSALLARITAVVDDQLSRTDTQASRRAMGALAEGSAQAAECLQHVAAAYAEVSFLYRLQDLTDTTEVRANADRVPAAMAADLLEAKSTLAHTATFLRRTAFELSEHAPRARAARQQSTTAHKPTAARSTDALSTLNVLAGQPTLYPYPRR